MDPQSFLGLSYCSEIKGEEPKRIKLQLEVGSQIY